MNWNSQQVAELCADPWREDNVDNVDLRQIAQVCINGQFFMEVYWRYETNDILINMEICNLWFKVPASLEMKVTLQAVLRTDTFELAELQLMENGKIFYFGHSEHGVIHREWMYYACRGYTMQLNLSMSTDTLGEVFQTMHDIDEYTSKDSDENYGSE
jgi:hypothetical protein